MHAAPSCTWYPSLCSVNPSILSLPLHSLLFPALLRMPKLCCHGYYYNYSAEYQPHKIVISLVRLQPSYLQVCLSHSLHLLACVTSCLSHYLSVCISVCPPVPAPQCSLSKHFISVENWGNNGPFWTPKASQFGIHFPQNNTIYYPSGRFYIPCLSFLLAAFSLSPQLCFQFTGRQEGWLQAACQS